jgi:DNA-binding transcriptional MerR regulator
MKDKKQRERMSKNNPMKNKEIRDRVSRKLRKHPIIDSKYYESVEEASKEFNVCTYTIRQWCKKGINPYNQKCHWSNEPEKNIQFINPHCKRIIYDGVEYSSIKELCNTINKRKCVIANWLKKGFDTKGRICRLVGDDKEYVFKKTNTSAKPVIINNVWYESVIGACRKLNITEQTLRYHIKNKTGKYDFKYDNQ